MSIKLFIVLVIIAGGLSWAGIAAGEKYPDHMPLIGLGMFLLMAVLSGIAIHLLHVGA